MLRLLRLRAVLEEKAARQRWRESVVRLRGRPERSRETRPRWEEMLRQRGKAQETGAEGRWPCRERERREVLDRRESVRQRRSSGADRLAVREASLEGGER